MQMEIFKVAQNLKHFNFFLRFQRLSADTVCYLYRYEFIYTILSSSYAFGYYTPIHLYCKSSVLPRVPVHSQAIRITKRFPYDYYHLACLQLYHINTGFTAIRVVQLIFKRISDKPSRKWAWK